MTFRRIFSFFFFLFSSFFFLFPSVFSQRHIEKGEIAIRNYHQKEYKGNAQNFSIVQDSRGVIYFANNGGVLEYDGSSWRTIKMPNETSVKAISINEKGKIFVGAQNELGYLAPDSTGNLSYYSLLEFIPEKNRNFEIIWKAFSTVKGIYFLSNSVLFLWDGTTMKSWTPETAFTRAFFVNNKLYLSQIKKGLFIMNGDEIAPVIDGESFSDKSIEDMIPLDNEKILAVTKNHGVFVFTADGLLYEQTGSRVNNGPGKGKITGGKKTVHVFSSETDDFLRGKVLHNCIRINDELYSIGTWGDGIIIIHKDGYIVRTITKEAGLQDNIIHFQYLDDHGNLWLALANGIAKIEINSPITSFTDKSGLTGTIETITRHNSILYAGTQTGVYFLPDEKSSSKKNDESSKFMAIPNIPMECWDLLSFTKGNSHVLLAGLNDGLYEIKFNHEISLIAKCEPWTLYQSKTDDARVYIGLNDGIMSVYYDNGHWINEGKINGIDELIFKIAEDEQGNLWLGTQKQGALKLNFYMGSDVSALVAKKGIRRDVKVFRYKQKDGLPEGDIIVLKEKNEQPLIGTDKGLFRFDEKKENFYPDSILMKKTTPQKTGIHRMNKDKKGNLWMVNYTGSEFEIGFAKFLSDTDIIWNSTPFIEISKGVIHAIYHDQHGITWLGGVDGLFQYNSNIEKDFTKPYNTLIRKVSIGEDSLIFKGTNFNDSGLVSIPQPDLFKNTISHWNNSISFEFAAQSFENESATLYSRYLQGFDKNWSDWKTEAKAVYTNLHEGKYVFRVKAKNLYKNISAEATYEFTILPPWYRTIWAYVSYVLLFLGILYFGIKLNIRRLELKNLELEGIIHERTAEITKQKEVIEVKNRDIMDSINYAQGIQQAILPPDEKFKKFLPDSFILFLPRDVVSGDFYWMEAPLYPPEEGTANTQWVFERDSEQHAQAGGNSQSQLPPSGGGGALVLFSVCDCTGHGVPGGFVSMVGQNGLRRAVNEQGLTQPAQILDRVSLIVEEAFRKGKRKDGMDAVLCSMLPANETDNNARALLQYSAANNPLYLVRKKENGLLHETIPGFRVSSLELNKEQKTSHEKPIEPDIETDSHYLFHMDPDKQPVGAYDYRKPFTNHEFTLKAGDTIYLSSDGFRDQFGGPKGKKFMAKNFKQQLVSMQNHTMDEQQQILHNTIKEWMGHEEQNDDICIIGVRV